MGKNAERNKKRKRAAAELLQQQQSEQHRFCGTALDSDAGAADLDSLSQEDSRKVCSVLPIDHTVADDPSGV